MLARILDNRQFMFDAHAVREPPQGFEINVVAEAIQADGFVDANGDPSADAAWTAFAAQMYK